MKHFRCPQCKRERYYEKLIMKVCEPCQKQMEVVNYGG
jgi:Zn finger protein HypA/HybF involved in hydrogenase expression